jgi:hypothetical protein
MTRAFVSKSQRFFFLTFVKPAFEGGFGFPSSSEKVDRKNDWVRFFKHL